MRSALLFVLVLPLFLLMDLAWLGLVVKGFYSQELGELARRQGDALAPRWGAAALVYLLIPAGVLLFVRPLLGDDPSMERSILWGAVYGLILYGVYDLTNLAVLDKWSVRMTVADIAWGCCLCVMTTVLMTLLDRWLTH